VQKSLMPKGVDHRLTREQIQAAAARVQKSLMPKGVDHMGTEKPAFSCWSAKIFDAERR